MLCRLGGSKKGIEEEVRAGDVMVIPAGVAHERYVQDPKTVSHSYVIQSYMAGRLQRKSVNGMSLYTDALIAQTVVVQRCTEDKSVVCSIVCMRDAMQHNMQLL